MRQDAHAPTTGTDLDNDDSAEVVLSPEEEGAAQVEAAVAEGVRLPVDPLPPLSPEVMRQWTDPEHARRESAATAERWARRWGLGGGGRR